MTSPAGNGRDSKAGSGLAAAQMDAIYRYQRYIYDATRKFFLLGRDRLLDELRPPAGGTVLEIGCGTGRNLVLAARRYPSASLCGFDISRVMLDTARGKIASSGLETRVRVAEGDATSFDPQALFGVAGFDRVFISYALSMIPPWREALPQALQAVKPGGRLHIVDFGQQEDLPRWFHRILTGWLARFSVEPRADLEAILRRVAAEQGCTVQFERALRGYCDHAVVTRPV
ncbi:MAG: class I SAM-dependent methyltransferase [Alsobacter sp.]